MPGVWIRGYDHDKRAQLPDVQRSRGSLLRSPLFLRPVRYGVLIRSTTCGSAGRTRAVFKVEQALPPLAAVRNRLKPSPHPGLSPGRRRMAASSAGKVAGIRPGSECGNLEIGDRSRNIHGALPYIRFAPILALVGVGVNRIGKQRTIQTPNVVCSLPIRVNAHDRYTRRVPPSLPSKARHRLEQRCRPRDAESYTRACWTEARKKSIRSCRVVAGL